MSDVERAVRDLAVAVRLPESVRVAKVQAYRSLVNSAAVVAVLVILVTVALSLV